ncbi:MAG: acetylglutamate kinase [Lactobacillales bacterium]|jgi:acetylglutamate kinase|nr:acetylglutamate kinase [Lactobacillales bacterium]
MSEFIVIKIGGVAGGQLNRSFFEELKLWQALGKQVIIVHGGGEQISDMMKKFDVPVVKKHGLRVTDENVLYYTKLALIGEVQQNILTKFTKNGFSAIGLNGMDGGLLQGDFIDYHALGHVGKVNEVNAKLLQAMTSANIIPIIAPLAMTENQQWLNVNADTAACKIAEVLQAESLYLLTDVPGVKKQHTWLETITLNDAQELLTEEEVTGGMIPKLKSAITAVTSGVKEVCITNEILEKHTVITL